MSLTDSGTTTLEMSTPGLIIHTFLVSKGIEFSDAGTKFARSKLNFGFSCGNSSSEKRLIRREPLLESTSESFIFVLLSRPSKLKWMLLVEPVDFRLSFRQVAEEPPDSW